ncbi:MAG: glutamate synthase [Planctomycetes bacterium]|nr:glutamate synthase [Planctomycetota bacterium]
MSVLVPYPFDRLVARMFRELREREAIFDLPARKFFRGEAGRDLSVRFHGKSASTGLGPAAGPHTQLAQNIVLSFLGGGRIFELKTVQVRDDLAIPRPCIDMRTVGYNIEWSQELRVPESLEEYVKASMLIEILVASGELGPAPGEDRTIFDLSVGYDLAGVQSEKVRAFLAGMMDARAVVEILRRQIPPELARFRDLDFRTRISDTLTLSTFHGCPPDEIERIIDWLFRAYGLSSVVKLNPTLLGKDEARRLFHDVLGYEDTIPDEAFDRDTRWDQAVDLSGRLAETARSLGLGFGVKFSNTLVVQNRGDFLPGTEKTSYLSGPPLHVLAVQLVARFREAFGDEIPISFSAGIDRTNFPDAVSLGLVPVTACSDLLRTGGYGRMHAYLAELSKRMEAAGARTVDEFVLLGQGEAERALERIAGEDAAVAGACRRALSTGADLASAAGPEFLARWLAEARLQNTRIYAERVTREERYRRDANTKQPPKVGTKLSLFDCITCDKCVPVCPNDANFTYLMPRSTIPVVKMRPHAGGVWEREEGPPLALLRRHQIGNYADFCNDCGNCDVFCPEDGGPYAIKPRFFGSREAWERARPTDGFHLAREGGRDLVLGRFQGREYRLAIRGDHAEFSGDGFDVRCDARDPAASIEGRAESEVDLTYFHILNALREALFAEGQVNYINA